MTSPVSVSSVRRPWVGAGFVLLSNLCFGTTGPAAKAVIGAGLSPLEVVELRVTGAAIALWLVTLMTDPKSLRITRRGLPFLIAYGLLAFLGVQVFYFIAIARLPVGVALLLEYLAIVLVALWARFVEKRTLARTTWVGIVFAVAGLALIEQVWRGPVLDVVGGLAGLAAAACLAAYFLLGERAVGGRNPLALAAWGATIGAIAAAIIEPPWTLPFERLQQTAQLGPLAAPAWVALVYVILVGTVAAYVTGIAALRYLPSPVVGVMSTFEVIIASTTAWLLLGETLSPIELAGAATLFTGVVLAQFGGMSGGTADGNAKDANASSSTARRSHDGAASAPR